MQVKNEKLKVHFDLVSPLTKVMQSQFDDVKESLVENGLVAEGVANDQLANAIDEGCENIKPENIRSNVQIGNVKGKIVTTWDELDLEGKRITPVLDYNFVFYASNGLDAYYSYNTADYKGLYHVNLLTGEETQIWNEYYAWRYFFEDTKGNIYCGSSTSTSGLLHIKGKTVTQILNTGYYWQYFYEDSKGNVYCSSDYSSNKGIYYVDDMVVTQIYDIGYKWKYFVEDSKGNLYCVGDYNNSGILLLDGTTVTQIYNSGNGTTKLFKASNGNEYLSIYYGGIFLIDSGNVTQVCDRTIISNIFEDSKGRLYVSTNASNGLGLYCITDTTSTKIYETGHSFMYFLEDSKGNIYLSGGSSVGDGFKGILHIDGETLVATQIYTSSYGWKYFFEDSKGNVYVSNEQTNALLHLDGTTYKTVNSNARKWDTFFEDSKGNVYVSNSYDINETTNRYGLMLLNGTTCTSVYSYGYDWKYFFEDKNGNTYVSNTGNNKINSAQNKGILLLNGTTATQIYKLDYGWRYLRDEGEYIVVVNSNLPTPDSTIVLLKNGSVYTTNTKE